MTRPALAALLAMLLFGAAARAQQPIEPVEVPAEIIPALERTDVAFIGARAWPVDWTAREDLLVQATYAFIGGNGIAEITWRIVSLTPEGPIFGEGFELPGAGIESVSAHPQGAFLVLYEYRDGDPRCCPSGRSQVILARPAPQ